jgi:hypothetical protein
LIRLTPIFLDLNKVRVMLTFPLIYPVFYFLYYRHNINYNGLSFLSRANSTYLNNHKHGDPNEFWTGLIDGEGSFILTIRKNSTMKYKFGVQLCLAIVLHRKDRELLESLQSYLGVGRISKHDKNNLQLRVQSIKEMELVFKHLDKYPLITQKRADYLLFKQAFLIVQNKDHLTIEGLKKLVAIKAAMNLGLSSELKVGFPGVKPVERPTIVNKSFTPKDSYWIAGFISGEGCFFIDIFKSAGSKLGEAVSLGFSIGLHARDGQLLYSLCDYFKCVKGTQRLNKNALDYRVKKYSDIVEKIIPFFENYPIQGEKLKDFEDFKKVAELMQKGAHLTELGLLDIKKIKSGMNTGRVIS